MLYPSDHVTSAAIDNANDKQQPMGHRCFQNQS